MLTMPAAEQVLNMLVTAETGIEMPRDNLEAWTGQKCKIFWPDDAEWYDAVVRLYDRSSGKHNVWYPYDHQVSRLSY